MPATVRRLLAVAALQLSVIEAGTSLEQQIDWIHSSDLLDPTPFLEAGQMLLTTGTQFPADAPAPAFDGYVGRLVACGVVALGFGTEVVRSGTPPELTAACAAQGLTLVQVPYKTPFIAIARWVADLVATESRERNDWSLRAQQAVSLSALGTRGLAGVLATLASQLACRVAAFESDGSFDAQLSPDDFNSVELEVLSHEALLILRPGRRAATTVTLGGDRVFLQTLGPNGRLGGALAVVGVAVDDSATRSVTTAAVALAEMSLEQGRLRRSNVMPMHGELLTLILGGHADLALRAIPHFPRGPLRVILRKAEGDLEWFVDALERFASDRRVPLFLAPIRDELALVTRAIDWAVFRAFLVSHDVACGVSEVVIVEGLAAGIAQARHALDISAHAGRDLLEFSEVKGTAFLHLLSEPEVTNLADSLLGQVAVTREGQEFLRYASVWFAHNCNWDIAARQIGIHRHTLKARIERGMVALGLSADQFSNRAELWSLMKSLEFQRSE